MMERIYASFVAELLNGRDLQYENNEGEIKIPNFYEEKENRLYSLFCMLSNDDNNYYVCVYVDDAYVNMRASDYLIDRLKYINGKVRNKDLRFDWNFFNVMEVLSLIAGLAPLTLAIKSWSSEEPNKIKKLAQGLGYFMVVFAYCCICSILYIYGVTLVMRLFCFIVYLLINMFLTRKLYRQKRLALYQEFAEMYPRITDFIQERSYDERSTEASESEQDENNRFSNNQWFQVPNSDERIIVFNNDESDLI